jgi:hypothetical protein
VNDYNPATKVYVDESLTNLDLIAFDVDENPIPNVLTLDRMDEYTPVAQYNPATKKYVDDSITNLSSEGFNITVAKAVNAEKLGGKLASKYVSVFNNTSQLLVL